MSEPLDSILVGWKRHFASADATITWGGASERLEMELATGVHLVGEVDAWGTDANRELFFGEWKTANPREKKTWKQVWRMNPQTLSYGLLVTSRWPTMRRFTVRKAFKEQLPTFDHAWFRYSDAELEHWHRQLLGIAGSIAAYQVNPWLKPWQTNWNRCFKYGVNYACPYFECACNKLDWAARPAGATLGGDPTWSATSQRAAILQRNPSAIVLSPTMISDWLDCEELFRRNHIELVTPPKNESLALGGEFHGIVGKYYQGLVPKESTQ
jgi:hypothetical protein